MNVKPYPESEDSIKFIDTSMHCISAHSHCTDQVHTTLINGEETILGYVKYTDTPVLD